MLELSQSDPINAILGNDEFSYEIPLYQRRYVWNQTNWEKLWDDIFHQVNIQPAERGPGHFTGPIVTRFIDEKQRYEVIDGQQRLTTFEIIFCVIKDLCSGIPNLENPSVVEDAEKHVLDSSGNPRLTLTRYDKLTFETIVNGQYGANIHNAFDKKDNCLTEGVAEREIRPQVFNKEENVSSNILDAYDHFYEHIRTHVQGDSRKASFLLSAITSDFRLIHLSLGEGQQAEKVFESINATGRMLSDFDYLRNNLFLRSRILGKNEDGRLYRDVFYEKCWPFEDRWAAKELKAFLKAFLQATWNPKCLKEENPKPFEEYREYSKSLESEFEKDEDRIPYEFRQLSEWAESYQELQDDPDFENYVEFCKHLSFPDLESFLLFVTHGFTGTTPLYEVCVILESYIVRRLLVLETATYNQEKIKKDSYDNITAFFFNLVKEKDTFSTESFVKFLKEHKWPGNDEVMTAFEQAHSKDANFITYVFREIIKAEDREYTRQGRRRLQPLTWADHTELLETIQNYLENREQLRILFNRTWHPPCHYTE